MKNLSKKEIAVVKSLGFWNSKKIHGNRKSFKGLNIDIYLNVVVKKTERQRRRFLNEVLESKKDHFQIIKELIESSIRTISTPYFKTIIEGNTGYYYASSVYQHSDYNKTRLFDKTEKTEKLVNIFHKVINNAKK